MTVIIKNNDCFAFRPDVSLYHTFYKSVVQRPPPDGVIWPFLLGKESGAPKSLPSKNRTDIIKNKNSTDKREKHINNLADKLMNIHQLNRENS